ncbi:phospholipase A and acyltransferase 3-like [Alosa sapidissima]|uniref:phospholipase A and acyltransferase 3-like n=1 Tax=Alosa sapidissima TaxID=34773 RepID=UPI001C0914D5|nr:phospholipase A and acyltransferase 3-like [Alosa sapidissima]XP_041939512.1 phospholipase A and acyltransferase 3-like [Alosa sapidissima]
MAEPGDLIEIDRKTYRHWALFIGDGYVIHLTNDDDSSTSVAAIGASSASAVAIVKKQKLKDVAAGHVWRVNNSLDKKWKAKPSDAILKNAEQRVGEKIRYRLIKYNCEHFVTELRYGQPKSRQAQTAELVAAGGSGVVLVGVLGAIVAALVSVFAPRTF